MATEVERATACAPPMRMLLYSVAAALNNVAFGYDVGVISGSLSDMASTLSLSTFQQEMATSGLNFVSGLGALLVSGNLLDRLGRKPTLLIASLLLLVGSVVVACANSFGVLLLGRALQGLGSGSGWCACTVYITEVAPTEWRGALVAVSDIGINAGILLGYALDRAVNLSLPEQPELRWRIAMGLAAALPLLYICCCHPVLPESPRWLMLAGRETEATLALRRISGLRDEADATPRVQRELAAMRTSLSQRREVTWSKALWPESRRSRRLVVIAMLLGLAQQLTGTEAILYYTPRILNQCPGEGERASAGGGGAIALIEGGGGGAMASVERGGECTSAETIFLVSLGVGLSKLFGELVAAAVVERTGRRAALTTSNLLVSLAVFAIALKFACDWPAEVGAVALSLVMLLFSLGPGPLTWVVINEVLPLALRAKVVAIALLCNRVGSGTIALTFLSLKEAVGVVAAFSLYGALGLLVTCFYHFCVPDVTGQALEQNEDTPEVEAVGGADGGVVSAAPPQPSCPCPSLVAACSCAADGLADAACACSPSHVVTAPSRRGGGWTSLVD